VVVHVASMSPQMIKHSIVAYGLETHDYTVGFGAS
jgi:hypothetical protein